MATQVNETRDGPRLSVALTDTETSAVRVLLVSRFSLSRQMLQSALEHDPRIKIVATAETPIECALRLADIRADVVIADGVEAVREELGPLAVGGRIPADVRVLVIAPRSQEEACLEAVRMGVAGYVTASVGHEELCRAVQAVRNGETVLPDHLARALVSRLAQRSWCATDPVVLTPRERDVLRALAGGLTDKQIAAQLSMAPGTVRIHLRSVYRKLGLRNRAQAAVFAASHGLDAPAPDAVAARAPQRRQR
jgi:DNA-binding NarL/FixJ family response regulator